MGLILRPTYPTRRQTRQESKARKKKTVRELSPVFYFKVVSYIVRYLVGALLKSTPDTEKRQEDSDSGINWFGNPANISYTILDHRRPNVFPAVPTAKRVVALKKASHYATNADTRTLFVTPSTSQPGGT